MKIAAASIVAKSGLPYARVLAASLRRHHPELPFFVLLADEADESLDARAEPFELLTLREVAVPDFEALRSRYTALELLFACTPALLRHLLEGGCDAVAYFKQESLVVGDLAPVFSMLGRHSIVLTPHLRAPLGGGDALAREANILQSGVYNAGFLGVSATATGLGFLAWWQDRLKEHCRLEVQEGLHYEQRWLDLVPSYFEDFAIVRDAGFNVGHWNLPELELRVDGERVLAGGRPCSYLRFSGYDPELGRPTRYSTRLAMETLGDGAEIFRRYGTLLREAGSEAAKRSPNAFENPRAVLRALARRLRPLGRARDLAGRLLRSLRE